MSFSWLTVLLLGVTLPTMGQKGKDNPNWKGGRTVDPRGYVLIRVGVGHHLADVRGYAYEHRLIGEKILGRRLRRGEQVHHDNEKKGDNRRGNLKPKKTVWDHRVEHRTSGKRLRLPGERNPMILCPCGCGARFRKYDEQHRLRRYLPGHNTHPSPTINAILDCLKRPFPLRDIARRIGKGVRATKVCLSRMKRQGLVSQRERGVWQQRAR